MQSSCGKLQWILIIERYANVDDLAEADRVFSMLMGDEVPRREFIENAVYAVDA
jgi:DNA gyrase/topoisomerase IV subunit B